MDSEFEEIKRFVAFIEKRYAEGASAAEVEKLYEDLHSLQQNYYLGQLLGDDDE